MKKNLRDSIIAKIEEIKLNETSKGLYDRKAIHKRLKRELNELVPDCKEYDAGKYVIEVQYNPVIKKRICAIYTQESWANCQSFRKHQKIAVSYKFGKTKKRPKCEIIE